MTFSVTMPALGESVSEGTVTRWLKSAGDQVASASNEPGWQRLLGLCFCR